MPDPPTLEEEATGCAAVQKILRIGHFCACKGPMQKAHVRYCKLRLLAPKKMVKHVQTRWNTMYGVVKRALDLRKALTSLCASELWNYKLGHYNLSAAKWKILEGLLPVFKYFILTSERNSFTTLSGKDLGLILLSRSLIGCGRTAIKLSSLQLKTPPTPLTKTLSAFSVLDNPAPKSPTGPFDAFIRGNPSNKDPIKFWTAALPHQKSQTITANQALAFMALDFLAATAASTDVEHLFSRSGLVVSKKCYNLTPQHIHESTILGNWLSVEGLVPVDAIQHKLNKGYRKEKHFASEDELCWSDSDIEKDRVSKSELEIVEVKHSGDEGERSSNEGSSGSGSD
ncbi:hypothetical protein BDP27DRAFT_1424848 [Rhodocollybia butyracea]|uniref:HAT C-terminal dimerisation domain-containing protein n=1 Tax=Rhodocollybia butyracea TaxID=206335 RepID=A0A9P5PK70_9AGAR|nr:hypothetical protein BDP27DRAFT_1424848 [Rhodocollybia butyracea]